MVNVVFIIVRDRESKMDLFGERRRLPKLGFGEGVDSMVQID